jgi:hypothetical protein
VEARVHRDLRGALDVQFGVAEEVAKLLFGIGEAADFLEAIQVFHGACAATALLMLLAAAASASATAVVVVAAAAAAAAAAGADDCVGGPWVRALGI